MNKRPAESGFTLVEALIALVIVGLSFAVLLKVISDNLDRTRLAQDEATAALVAQSLLARSDGSALVSGSDEGRFNVFAWRVTVEPYEGAKPSSPVGAVTVAATVSWRDDGEIHWRTLTTLRIVPRAAPR